MVASNPAQQEQINTLTQESDQEEGETGRAGIGERINAITENLKAATENVKTSIYHTLEKLKGNVNDPELREEAENLRRHTEEQLEELYGRTRTRLADLGPSQEEAFRLYGTEVTTPVGEPEISLEEQLAEKLWKQIGTTENNKTEEIKYGNKNIRASKIEWGNNHYSVEYAGKTYHLEEDPYFEKKVLEKLETIKEVRGDYLNFRERVSNKARVAKEFVQDIFDRNDYKRMSPEQLGGIGNRGESLITEMARAAMREASKMENEWLQEEIPQKVLYGGREISVVNKPQANDINLFKFRGKEINLAENPKLEAAVRSEIKHLQKQEQLDSITKKDMDHWNEEHSRQEREKNDLEYYSRERGVQIERLLESHWNSDALEDIFLNGIRRRDLESQFFDYEINETIERIVKDAKDSFSYISTDKVLEIVNSKRIELIKDKFRGFIAEALSTRNGDVDFFYQLQAEFPPELGNSFGEILLEEGKKFETNKYRKILAVSVNNQIVDACWKGDQELERYYHNGVPYELFSSNALDFLKDFAEEFVQTKPAFYRYKQFLTEEEMKNAADMIVEEEKAKVLEAKYEQYVRNHIDAEGNVSVNSVPPEGMTERRMGEIIRRVRNEIVGTRPSRGPTRRRTRL